MWQRWLSVLVLGVCLSPILQAADESAEEWLKAMLAASKDVSFSGHSVLLSSGRLVSLKVYHAPIDGEVWERVVHMSGEPAEIIRQGGAVYCLHPRQSTGMAVKSPLGRWSALDQGMQEIARYYRFDRAGVERVAGRDAVRLNLSPLDSHRYGYSLWLDAKSGVILRSQTLPPNGDALEIFEYVSISFGEPLTQADFEPGQGLTRSQVSRDSVSNDQASPAEHWAPEWLPEGFVESQRVARFEGQGQVSTRAFTDGLASFTVFHEPQSKPVSANVSAHGATVAVHHNIPGAMITVVGEIPMATAERIAESVKPLAEAP
jgi:sigma-E factor negative regulatory protein RseB